MNGKIIYVQEKGKYMSMDAELSDKLELGLIIRYYKLFDTYSFFINPSMKRQKKMTKSIKTDDDNYIYVSGKVTYNYSDDITDPYSWKITLNSEIEDASFKDWFERTERGLKLQFINKYCVYGPRFLTNTRPFIEDSFFFKDTSIMNAANTSIYLFGRGHIYTEGLHNVMLYVFGEYDID